MRNIMLTIFLIGNLIFAFINSVAKADDIVTPYPSECDSIVTNITTSDYLPRNSLLNGSAALRCLVIALSKTKVGSIDELSSRRDLVRIISAIRLIFDSYSDPPYPAIDIFHAYSNINAVSNLAFGARSDDYAIRVNATIVLGNISNNENACVILDHIYDPKINEPGLFNMVTSLLFVPEASHALSLRNLSTTIDYLRHGGSRTNTHDNFLRALSTLERKVKFQTSTSPPVDGIAFEDEQEIGLDSKLCRGYEPIWANERILGARFTSYIHFRNDVIQSRDFVNLASDRLSSAGFYVPTPEDTPSGDRGNTRIVYFYGGSDALAQRVAAFNAKRAITALSPLPLDITNFNLIGLKTEPNAAPQQIRRLGIWF